MITLISGWIPGSAAECTDSRVYPLSFMIYMYLYISLGIFSISLYKLNFLMSSEKIREFAEMEDLQRPISALNSSMNSDHHSPVKIN